MTSSFCPECGNARQGQLRFCASCGFDFWKAAAGVVPTEATTGPTSGAPPAARAADRAGGSWFGKAIIVTTIIGALAAGIWIVQGALSNADEPDGSTGSTNRPPAGEIWFGSSFDADTLDLRGRTSSIGTNDAFSLVGRLPRAMDAGDLAVRIYFDDQLVSSDAFNASGNSDLWGFSPGPLFSAGKWRFEFTDVGGSVLASGQVTAE